MSNLDRYTFDNFANRSRSEKITLAIIEPKQRLISWVLHSGNIYKKLVNYYVSNLKEEQTTLTQVNSLVELDAANKWFYDIDTSYLYYWATNDNDPINYFMTVTYKMFFSNAPINLPLDMQNSAEVEYYPNILSISKFTNQLDDDNASIALEGTGRISFQNTDGFFQDIFDLLYWVDATITIYSYNRKMKPENAIKLFYGKIKDKQYSAQSVQFQVKDFFESLSSNLPLPIYTTSDGDIPADILGTCKRRIYGRVDGLKAQTIDAVLEGFTLSGLYTVNSGSLNTVYGNSESDIINEVTPNDEITIDNQAVKVASVNQDYFTLVESLTDSITNVIAINRPEINYRRKNRDFLIAHHALRQPTTYITQAISENKFYVNNITDIEPEEIIFISDNPKKIRRIVGNKIILYTDLTYIPQPNEIVYKSPISNVYFNKQRISESDYSITNESTGCKLTLSELAEPNLVKGTNLIGILSFKEDSNIVTTARVLLSGELQFTKDSNIVTAKETELTGAIKFTNGSKQVVSGNISIEGQLQFTNGSNIVTTKKTDLQAKLRFTKDSNIVNSDTSDLRGLCSLTNSSVTVKHAAGLSTGKIDCIQNSVKIKTKTKTFTGKAEFVNGSNYVQSKINNVTGKIRFINGSASLIMYVENINGTKISFTKDSNFVTGINTTFVTDVEAGDYIRPNNLNNWYEVKTVHSDTSIELLGEFSETSIYQSYCEKAQSGWFTKFTDLTTGDYIKEKNSNTWYQIDTVTNDYELILTSVFSESSINEDAQYVNYTNFVSEVDAGNYIKPDSGDTYYEVLQIIDFRTLIITENYIGDTKEEIVNLSDAAWLTDFSELTTSGYIKPNLTGKWYKISEIINNYELNLEDVFSETTTSDDFNYTLEPSYFLSDLVIGDSVRVNTEAWYEVDNIINDSEFELTSSYLGTTKDINLEYATAPSLFLTEISEGDYIRPIGANYNWYKVKRIVNDEQLILYDKFKEDIEAFGYVTSTPTFFNTSTNENKIVVGDNIKLDSGIDYFEVASITNDFQLILTTNFDETTANGTANKSTGSTIFLSEITAGQFIRPEVGNGKFYEVDVVNSDSLITLVDFYNEDTTSIIKGYVSSTPTDFLTEINIGDTIQLEEGVDWFEVVSVENEGRLTLTNNYTKTTGNGISYKNTLGSFLSQLKNRDWIKPDNTAIWYEILEVQSNTRLLLRDKYRSTDLTTTAQKKNVEYIGDDSDLIVDCIGKTKTGTAIGEYIKTIPDIVRDLLIEQNYENNLLESSFVEANEDAPYLPSLKLPIEKTENSPKLKDVINLLNGSIFGSLYNDRDYNIKYSILSTKKPDDIELITDSDIINYSVDIKSNTMIKKVYVHYQHKDIDIYGGDNVFNSVSQESSLLSNLGNNTKEKTIKIYLYDTFAASTFAQRYIFYNELAKAIIKITAKLNLAKYSLNDILLVNLDNLYTRLGNFSDNSKIAFISMISKNGENTEIKLNDLGNAFNRIATIANNDNPIYADSNDYEKIFAGFITDDNNLINDNEETFNINLIG